MTTHNVHTTLLVAAVLVATIATAQGNRDYDGRNDYRYGKNHHDRRNDDRYKDHYDDRYKDNYDDRNNGRYDDRYDPRKGRDSRYQKGVVRMRPPLPPQRYIERRPSPRHIWMPVEYVWRGGRYLYMPGYWMIPPRNGHRYIQGYWQPTRGGYVWMSGYWTNGRGRERW